MDRYGVSSTLEPEYAKCHLCPHLWQRRAHQLRVSRTGPSPLLEVGGHRGPPIKKDDWELLPDTIKARAEWCESAVLFHISHLEVN